MADPTPIAILVPNLLSSKPPPVIPRQLATVPIDVIHIPSTLRMLTSSVLLRRYDTMYGEKFPVKDRKLFFFCLYFCLDLILRGFSCPGKLTGNHKKFKLFPPFLQRVPVNFHGQLEPFKMRSTLK